MFSCACFLSLHVVRLRVSVASCYSAAGLGCAAACFFCAAAFCLLGCVLLGRVLLGCVSSGCASFSGCCLLGYVLLAGRVFPRLRAGWCCFLLLGCVLVLLLVDRLRVACSARCWFRWSCGCVSVGVISVCCASCWCDSAVVVCGGCASWLCCLCWLCAVLVVVSAGGSCWCCLCECVGRRAGAASASGVSSAGVACFSLCFL